MQFAINTPNFGSFADARLLAQLAYEAEDAGWEMLTYMRQFRTNDEPFDVLASGNTSGTEHQRDLDLIMPYIEAGATWWQETFAGSDSEELEAVRTRIRQGPPRLK